MRCIRVLCKDRGSTMRLVKGTNDGIVRSNMSHITVHPTESIARSSSISGPNVRWGPVAVFSMSSRLCLVVGAKRIDSNIEADVRCRDCQRLLQKSAFKRGYTSLNV